MRFAIALSLATLVACSSAAYADDETPPVVGGKTYVQHQILAAKSRHPEIVDITVVGKRPEDKAPVILGSTASARNVFKSAAEPADGSAVSGTLLCRPRAASQQHGAPSWDDRNQVP